MRINNNLLAMNTHRQLGISNAAGAKSMEKLSSGFRINRAGDDAAGLAISEKMRGQVRGLTQASRNAQDGISLIQTAEGALNETHAILQRMRELAVQSSTDTNTGADRSEIQKEIDQLSKEISRIAETTQFNTMNLLDGKYKDKEFHIGANAGQSATIEIGDMSAKTLAVDGKSVSVAASGIKAEFRGTTTETTKVVFKGSTDKNTTAKMSGAVAVVSFGKSGTDVTATKADIKAALESLGATVTISGTASSKITTSGSGTSTAKASGLGINVSTQKAADSAITTINTAISTVSSERSKLGAIQNRLEHTIKNLDTSAENLQASESRIRDVDMAKEMMEQTKQNILQQASTAMLAQANQAPQTVLQLLR